MWVGSIYGALGEGVVGVGIAWSGEWSGGSGVGRGVGVGVRAGTVAVAAIAVVGVEVAVGGCD